MNETRNVAHDAEARRRPLAKLLHRRISLFDTVVARGKRVRFRIELA